MVNAVWSGQTDFAFSFTKPSFTPSKQTLFTIPSGLVAPGRGIVVVAFTAIEDPGFVMLGSGNPSVSVGVVDSSSNAWTTVGLKFALHDSTYPATSCQSNSGGPITLSSAGWDDVIPMTATPAGLKVMQVVFTSTVFGATHGSMDCRVCWFDSGGTLLSCDASPGILSSGGTLTFDGLGPPVGAAKFSVQMQPIPLGITDQASATATSYCATGTPDETAMVQVGPILSRATSTPMPLELGATLVFNAGFVNSAAYAGCGESVEGTAVALLLDAQQSTFGGSEQFSVGSTFPGGTSSPSNLLLGGASSGKIATCIFGGVAGLADSSPAPTPSITGINWANQIGRVSAADARFYAALSLWTGPVPEPTSPALYLDPTITTPAGLGCWGIIQDVAWQLAQPRSFGTIIGD